MGDFKISKIDVGIEEVEQAPAASMGILPTHPFRMYIVGASGSGKTNLLLNILTREEMYADYFDSILILSPTALHLDKSYQVLGLDENHFLDCSVDSLERIRDIQSSYVEEKGIEETPKTLVILDDIISFTKFCNSDILRQFSVMSRHWNISMVVLSQAYHRIPKTIRLQMSAVIFFKGSNKEVDVLIEDLAPAGYTKRQFKRKIHYATDQKFSFLFVDLNRSIEQGRYRKNLEEIIV